MPVKRLNSLILFIFSLSFPSSKTDPNMFLQISLKFVTLINKSVARRFEDILD